MTAGSTNIHSSLSVVVHFNANNWLTSCLCPCSIGESSDEDEDEEGGVGSVESDHMLKPQFFEEIQRVLKVGGTVTVLTDNEWYGNFLASTLDGFAESGKCLLESVDLECTSTDAASANTSSVDYIDSATSARSRQASCEKPLPSLILSCSSALSQLELFVNFRVWWCLLRWSGGRQGRQHHALRRRAGSRLRVR